MYYCLTDHGAQEAQVNLELELRRKELSLRGLMTSAILGWVLGRLPFLYPKINKSLVANAVAT